MRSFKFAALAVLVASVAYVASLAIIPPKQSIAAYPSKELFSLEILRLAKEAPSGSYDAH